MKTVLSKLEAKWVFHGVRRGGEVLTYILDLTPARIITFLVGNPYKSLFVTVTGWGVDQSYIDKWLKIMSIYPLKLTSSHQKMDGWKMILALLGRQKAYFQGRWLPQVFFALNCYSKLFWDKRFVCFWREVEYFRSWRFKTGTKVRWLPIVTPGIWFHHVVLFFLHRLFTV